MAPPSDDELSTGDVAEQAAPSVPGLPTDRAIDPVVSPLPPDVRTVAAHSEDISAPGWLAHIHSANGALRGLTMTEYTAPPLMTPLWTWVMDKVSGHAEEGGWSPYQGIIS